MEIGYYKTTLKTGNSKAEMEMANEEVVEMGTAREEAEMEIAKKEFDQPMDYWETDMFK